MAYVLPAAAGVALAPLAPPACQFAHALIVMAGLLALAGYDLCTRP